MDDMSTCHHHDGMCDCELDLKLPRQHVVLYIPALELCAYDSNALSSTFHVETNAVVKDVSIGGRRVRRHCKDIVLDGDCQNDVIPKEIDATLSNIPLDSAIYTGSSNTDVALCEDLGGGSSS